MNNNNDNNDINIEQIVTQRELLKQLAKKTIKRIKELQKQLVIEEQECSDFGHYEDCGSYYQEQVAATKAVIVELIKQKITFEKWCKSLKYTINSNYGDTNLNK